jgi:hypothetical protein
MEWHVWDFPDNVRVCFSDEFRQHLFEVLKKVCGSRYRLAKVLELHPTTIKEYESAKSSTGVEVLIPVSVLKKIIEILRNEGIHYLIDELERHIVKIRMSGNGLVVNNPILPIKESEELYSFAAHMIGDGCASKLHLKYNNVPYYCSTERELIESFKKDLRIFGKFETKEYVGEDGVIYLRFPTVISNIVQHILNVRFTKPNKIPEAVFITSDSNKIAFIRAIYDDEGSVSSGKIYITQKSKQLLKQMKTLLMSLGIETSKIMTTQTGGHRGHRFVIRTKSYEKFYNLIKFNHPKKKMRLEEIIIKMRAKPVPIKYRVLDLLQKSKPLTKWDIVSILGLRVESVNEALSSLHKEQKISYKCLYYTKYKKVFIWYPKV